MSSRFSPRRVAAATLAGGLLVVLQVGLAGGASAAPYPAPVATNTIISFSDTLVAPNGTVSVTVEVEAGIGTPTGTLKVTVEGVATFTRSLGGDGQASLKLPTDLPAGTYQVLAEYSGSDGSLPPARTAPLVVGERSAAALPGVAAVEAPQGYAPSSARGSYTIDPSLAANGGSDSGSTGGTSGGSSGSSGSSGLSGTGVSLGTEMAGLLGLLLVGAGAATVLVHRRRVRA
jgi:Big-like domain-containing protein